MTNNLHSKRCETCIKRRSPKCPVVSTTIAGFHDLEYQEGFTWDITALVGCDSYIPFDDPEGVGYAYDKGTGKSPVFSKTCIIGNNVYGSDDQYRLLDWFFHERRELWDAVSKRGIT